MSAPFTLRFNSYGDSNRIVYMDRIYEDASKPTEHKIPYSRIEVDTAFPNVFATDGRYSVSQYDPTTGNLTFIVPNYSDPKSPYVFNVTPETTGTAQKTSLLSLAQPHFMRQQKVASVGAGAGYQYMPQPAVTADAVVAYKNALAKMETAESAAPDMSPAAGAILRQEDQVVPEVPVEEPAPAVAEATVVDFHDDEKKTMRVVCQDRHRHVRRMDSKPFRNVTKGTKFIWTKSKHRGCYDLILGDKYTKFITTVIEVSMIGYDNNKSSHTKPSKPHKPSHELMK